MHIIISLNSDLLEEILKKYFFYTDGDDDTISLADFIVDILETRVKKI